MLILASQSKIRRQILEQAGIAFSALSSPFDETAAKQRLRNATPQEIAANLAKGKAEAVSVANPGAYVLGADQTLDLDGVCFDKPRDVEAARQHLLKLRGKTHYLHSALTITRSGKTLWQTLETATLTMRNFSDAFLGQYLDAEGRSACESVGAYKLEGRGIQLFEGIAGDYFTILGLPLFPLLKFLRAEGLAPE